MNLSKVEFEVGHIIEFCLLIFLILYDVADFLEIISPDLDYVKILVSWTCLGYLLYSLGMSKQLVGTRNHLLDFSLLTAFFLLVFKEVVGFTLVAYDELREMVFHEGYHSFVFPFVEFIRDPAHQGAMANYLSHLSFSMGAVLLLLCSLGVVFFLRIEKPSVLHVLHEDEPSQKTLYSLLKKFVLVFLVFTGFFVVVFNLMMEWLALTVDASLLTFTLLFYLFTLFRRHHQYLNTESFFNKVGSAAETFYEEIIALFHSQKTFFLGLAGLLVLHLLTDVGIFVVPAAIGIHDAFYFSQLPGQHTPLVLLYVQDIGQMSGAFTLFSLAFGYFFNIIGMLFLLSAPGFFWYFLLRKRTFQPSSLTLSLVFTSLCVLVFWPAFMMKKIVSSNLVGVDILTQNIQGHVMLLLPVSLAVFALIFVLTSIVRKFMVFLTVLLVQVFFGIYIVLYSAGIIEYYLAGIFTLFHLSTLLIFLFLLLFFLLSFGFYVIGFFSLLYELKKAHWLVG